MWVVIAAELNPLLHLVFYTSVAFISIFGYDSKIDPNLTFDPPRHKQALHTLDTEGALTAIDLEGMMVSFLYVYNS